MGGYPARGFAVTAPLSFEEFERQRKSLSFEEFERQQAEPKPRGAISELTRGAALGLATAGTSLGEVVGMIPGLGAVGEASRRAQQEAEAFYDPRGGFGTAGQVGGRLVGEVAQAALGGPLVAKALGRVAPGAAKAIQAGMASPSRLTRAGATAAANVPIDVLQGLKEEEGLLLGGRAGSVAENVLFSGAAGALLPAARQARVPETRPEQLRLLGAEATPEDIANYLRQRTFREQAAGRGAIPSATGRSARRPGQPMQPELELGKPGVDVPASAIDEEAAIERAAIMAENIAQPSLTEQLYTMPLDELKKRVPKGVILDPKRIKRLSNTELETAVAYETRLLQQQMDESGFLADPYTATMFREGTHTGTSMGYKGAKRMFGTAEEARKAKGLNEEMLGFLEERNISVDDFRAMEAADAKRVNTEKRLTKLQAEYDRRGLGQAADDVSFDPSEFMREGFARPELVSQLGAAALGGVAGGATAAPEDRADFVGRTLLGAAAGGLGARGLMRAMTQAPGAPRRVGAAAAPKAPEVTVNGRDYINVGRITDDPALQQRLVSAAERAAAAGTTAPRRPARAGETLGRLEQPETLEAFKQRVAQRFGMTTTEFVERTKKGQRVGRDELAIAERALDDITKEADDLYIKLGQAGAMTADEAAQAERRLADLYREQDALFGAYTTQVTETARDLSALRAGITKSNNPTVWLGRLQKVAKRPLTDEERGIAINAARRGDTKALMDLAKSVTKFTFGEKAAAVIRSGMLYAPKTHLANLFGNTLMVGGLENLKDIPATAFDMAIGAARRMAGQEAIRTKAFDPKAMAVASGDGALKGLRAAKEAARNGIVDPSKVDLVREVNFKSPLANLVVNAPFRALEASDQFFRTISISKSLDEQARVMAQAEFKGVKGVTPEVIAQRTKEILESPSDEMMFRAAADADYATFRDDTALSRFALSMRNKLRGVLDKAGMGPAADVLFPFVKTPANIATRIVEYTPLGALKYADAAKLATLLKGTPDYALQKKFVEDLGRVATGTAIAYVGYKLAQNDRMTGFYPPTTNQRERNRWETTGRQEGSLKIGDQWVEITRLSPVGNLLQIGAALNDISKGGQNDALTQLLGAATAPARSVFDLPTVTGLRDIIEAMRESGTVGGGEAIKRFGARVATSLVPGSALVRGIGYGMDPYMRETKAESPLQSALRRVQSSVPGASQQLPIRYDPLGEPMRREGGFMQSLVSPFPTSRVKTAGTPVRAELERTGASVAPIERRKGESDESFSQRKQVTGSLIGRALDAAIRAPGYQAISRMEPIQLRQLLLETGVPAEEVDRISDDQLRTRTQGYVLDLVTQRVKSEAASTLFPAPVRGQRESLRRALTRP
jgi:hypothetical protein